MCVELLHARVAVIDHIHAVCGIGRKRPRGIELAVRVARAAPHFGELARDGVERLQPVVAAVRNQQRAPPCGHEQAARLAQLRRLAAEAAEA
ncbi:MULTISPECIES: hypothetical protein [unclassified Burkholderia]|uniref:hypothetical protein n=1 Tax=unclassified Burkholderia TaxID=2613784 RepID=UPI001F03AC76|nr:MULTISPECIES: hypothetical protein [unclassified Burkholderia]